MELRKVTAPMGLIKSKAALIKPALRGFFVFFSLLFVLKKEHEVLKLLLVCLPVHLCVNKHPLEDFYLCNFVSESQEGKERERGREEGRLTDTRYKERKLKKFD